MKKYIYMAVAAIAALSSCSSDNDPIMGETGKQALVFTATIEGSEGTRATYDSGNKCASWEIDDQISINGQTYNAQSTGLTTTFRAAIEGQEAEGSTYEAYFPASLYNGTTATLPANVNETWAAGKFNMPMYATSTTTDLPFKNLCGVLKITVNSGQIAAVKKIKVSSANCATSGAFTVDAITYAAKLTDASDTANTVTVTYTEAVTTDATGKVFYVAVPAQTYQGLKIELDADGSGFTKSMTTKSATDITVARNTIYPITFADNATTGTAKRTGDIDVTWVQLWENGPKFAEYNVGASSATDVGTTMTFIDAIKTGAEYVWGANWCTPSMDDMNELLLAAQGYSSSKVTCEYTQEDDGTWGFKFTGKETGYTDNSVFFPAQSGDSNFGCTYYWSATADDIEALYMLLNYENGIWYSDCYSDSQDTNYLVRPVLKN